jgi:molecular chaperone GrpE
VTERPEGVPEEVETPPEDASEPEEPEESAERSVERDLAELTDDLQRLQAEYVNYRKRVERDRATARTMGEATVLRSLLTVLDDIGRAEEHGELEGGFKAVADALQQAVRSHGLESFGAVGDVFDPRLHEALFHAGESADVDVTTVQSIIRTGYRVGDNVLRHAQVGVVDPAAVPGEAEPRVSPAERGEGSEGPEPTTDDED